MNESMNELHYVQLHNIILHYNALLVHFPTVRKYIRPAL